MTGPARSAAVTPSSDPWVRCWAARTMPAPAPGSSAPRSITLTPPAAEPEAKGTFISSPFVGTFYRAPSPEAPVFVEVGQSVRKGQVVCIVEAMKLMNEIVADVSGEVVEVLAENAGGVEYDQPLFYLRPDEQ